MQFLSDFSRIIAGSYAPDTFSDVLWSPHWDSYYGKLASVNGKRIFNFGIIIISRQICYSHKIIHMREQAAYIARSWKKKYACEIKKFQKIYFVELAKIINEVPSTTASRYWGAIWQNLCCLIRYCSIVIRKKDWKWKKVC